MDPMHVQIVERYCAEGDWDAESALHLGGESDAFEQGADMVLLRDAHGKPFIPGASLAGACRSYLRGNGKESDALLALFGGDVDCQKNQRDYASALTVFDALPSEEAAIHVFVRDGVRIDRRTGIAEDKLKFDYEVLPAGTSFRVRLELVVYSELPYGVTRDNLLAMFRAMLEALACGEIRLGARTRRGLGRGKVREWTIRRIDMKNRSHVIAWLRREANAGEPVKLEELPPPPAGLHAPWLTIQADLALKTSLLIRSGGEAARAPDMVHLSEKGRPLLTGTSLGGALRSRCERIARTLFSESQATRITEAMFGTWHRREDPEEQLRAGRVLVEETELDNGSYWVQGRVAIDRFTGGALETALFDQAPYYPTPKPQPPATDEVGISQVRITIRLRDPDQTEAALLLQAFKDLWLGDLPVGGEAGVGRGVFRGISAEIGHTSLGRVQMKAADPADPAKVIFVCLEPKRASAAEILAKIGALSAEAAQ
jgi:CRISPR/Cas system CSM-associated protein Csm3 (group 7 of RAMP superfamily)